MATATAMQRGPMTALRVGDLDVSLRFYVEQIGCVLVAGHVASGAVTIEHEGFRFVLAADLVDLSSLLDPAHEILRPPATVFLNGGASDGIGLLRDRLVERGVIGMALTERWWGDHILDATDPDGYRVRFWTTTERQPDETLALYEAGVEALERALAGLSEADLDRASAPGEWTMRQIVHHLADSEAAVLQRTMAALAEPGRVWESNAYLQDAWVSGLDHAGRDIGPSVALIRAVRGYLCQLVRHLPDAWERSTIGPGGHTLTVGATVGMLMSHAYEHLEDVERVAGGG